MVTSVDRRRTRHGPARGARPTRKRSTRRGQPMLIGAVVGAAAVAAAMTLYIEPIPLPGAQEATPKAFVSPTGLFVDPDSPAAKQVQQWRKDGRVDDARRIGEVAAQPMPLWVNAPTGEAGAQVAAYVGRAVAAGQRAFIVIKRIPGLDCGSGQGGGARDAGDYRAWIREVGGGLGGREATIILEPDAVPQELTGCVKGTAKVKERQTLLADAVRVLKDNAPVKVYLDAGNPGLVTDVVKLADALQRSGLGDADGFSLNIGNVYPTADVVAYGKKLSAKVGDKHFVVDTGRNGKPPAEGEKLRGTAPCNPQGRGIGQTPTTETGEPLVDAYLWVKRVGESDGSCRPGEPAAGKWWPDYALGMVPA
jgi:endoglucanase